MQLQVNVIRSNLLPRGVWEADYLVRGCRALLAINRDHECVRRVRIRAGVDEEIARAWLEGLLERLDPAPQLTLVRDEPQRSSRDTLIRRICAAAPSRPQPRANGAPPATRGTRPVRPHRVALDRPATPR